MKKVILLLFLFTLGSIIFAHPRLTIIERYTNASCGPCASINNSWYNSLTQNLVNTEQISHLVYNVWWPGASDPMYQLNLNDNTTRTNYYGVNAVPWIVANGTTIGTSAAALNNAVTNGNSQFSPFAISFEQIALSENLIKIKVIVHRDTADVTTFGNTKLRVALTEKTVSFSSPPGSNGEKDFFSICRKMLPDALGTTLTIPNPGETTEVTLEYLPTTQFQNAVNFDSLRVVAFIQSDDNKYIYQSAMYEMIPNFVAVLEKQSPDVLSENSSKADFTAVIKNVGVMDDTYMVDAALTSPGGWTGEYTTENGTFAFGDTDMINVSVGDSGIVNLSINPSGINGYGEAQITFTSQNDPGVGGTLVFRCVTTTGVPGLVIDASGAGYADLVLSGMDQEFNYTYGSVSSNALYDGVDLTNYSLITWSSGNQFPIFEPYEVTALEAFLDNGGLLLINGQDIGADIFEVTGQSQFAQSFYNNYLHADYIADWGLAYFFIGYAGDPISDGAAFSINNIYDRSPDHITPIDQFANPILRASIQPNENSIRVDDGNFKVVYFGLGFEQISDAAQRDTLIARSIRWLMDGIVLSTPKNEVVVNTFNLDQNYPNPFNPSTSISYSLADESQVSLKIYDVMGREVAELVNSKQSAGSYSINFDASSLASGIYIYKLSAGDFISAKKMTLLK